MKKYIKKEKELCYAAEVAKRLQKEWVFEEFERPDFIVHDGECVFGLEVSEIFAGAIGRDGSKSRTVQSENQKKINEMRREYEQSGKSAPLRVHFLGKLDESHKQLVVGALLDMELYARPEWYPFSTTLSGEQGGLKLLGRRLPDGDPRDGMPRPDWHHAGDTVGLVEGRSPKARKVIERKLRETVRKKSAKLENYKVEMAKHLGLKNVDRVDIRLLLVSDHMWEYGMVFVDKMLAVNPCGFSAVYFYPHPEKPFEMKPGSAINSCRECCGYFCHYFRRFFGGMAFGTRSNGD